MTVGRVNAEALERLVDRTGGPRADEAAGRDAVGRSGAVAARLRRLAGRLEELAGRLETRAAGAPGTASDRGEVRVLLPFTGEELGRVPATLPAEVGPLAARAREAAEAWVRLPFRRRPRPFLRLHDLVLARREQLLDLVQLESGKARLDAFEEVADVAIVARHYALHGGRWLRTRRRRGAVPGLTAAWERRVPRGVVGVIAPWNYPLSLALGDAIPALLAGNAVLLKPDPQATFTALAAEALLAEAGLPPGLFQVLPGEGPELGPALVGSVDYLAFTGGTETGRVVARQAAERLIGFSLELGGKNPMVVFADADLDRAVEGAARGAFSSAGQLCLSIERIHVQRPLHDAFLERFAERARALRLGAGLDYGAEMGSLVSEARLRRVEAHVADALERGARVVAGGRARPEIGPFFHEPTVLTGVTEAMLAGREETFGPVVSVDAFETAEQAAELANRGPNGLNASVWTRDVRFGRRFAARIRAGTVNLNDAYAAAWASVDAPMGGMGDSGVGRRHGREGIRQYTEAQTVALQRGLPLGPRASGDAERWTRRLARYLKLVRRIPGLR